MSTDETPGQEALRADRRTHGRLPVQLTISGAKIALDPVQNPEVDTIDGLSLELADWGLSVRASNTAPLLRLRGESRGDAGLITVQLATLESLIRK